MVSFFLWPMIVPIIIPILYCWKCKKESLKHLWPILLCMLLIVMLYEPVVWGLGGLSPSQIGYVFWKFVLFVFLPLEILHLCGAGSSITSALAIFGVKKRGARKSLKLAMIFLPMMLATEFIVSLWLGRNYSPSSSWYSAIMFFESFTEEFFFRGILFLYLWKITDVRVAYITSITCFVLVHPQYFWGLGMLTAIVQGILTAAIVHKSKNLTGAWVLHGANRVFSLSVLPWFL